MKKIIFLTSAFSALALVSCGGQSDEVDIRKETVVKTPEVKVAIPNAMSEAKIIEKILAREPSDSAGMLADAALLYDQHGDVAARDVSNNLWGGINGFARNRRASGAIAVTAFNNDPQDWSTLRSGIAYVNGMGVPQDAQKAINILSNSALLESAGAQFFLGKAYALDGQTSNAISRYEAAANMGHKLAQQELAKMR